MTLKTLIDKLESLQRFENLPDGTGIDVMVPQIGCMLYYQLEGIEVTQDERGIQFVELQTCEEPVLRFPPREA